MLGVADNVVGKAVASANLVGGMGLRGCWYILDKLKALDKGEENFDKVGEG